MSNDILRRNFLKGAAAVAALGTLAGCAGDDTGEGTPTDGEPTTTDGEPTTTDDGATTTTAGEDTATTDGGEPTPTTTDGGNTPGNGGGDGQAAVEDYMAEANNFESIEDMTGQSEVSVDVGAGNGFAFGPAAVRVSPGTTVTWSWTGEGGSHNVVSTADVGSDFEFRSGDPQSSGTFDRTFEEAGVALYYCEPHQAGGMKGAVLVE